MRRLFLVTICFNLFYINALAQDVEASCKVFLQDLEKAYSVTFNYESDRIDSLECISLDITLDLQGHLNLLKEITGFEIEKLSDNRYSIKKNHRSTITLVNKKNFPIANVSIADTDLTSNQYGKIFIPNNFDKNVITFGHTDYTFYNFRLEGNKDYTVQSKERIVRLDETEIIPLFQTGVYLGNNNNFIIKPKEVHQLAGLTQQDIIKTAQNLPSVFSINESASNLSIRAGTNDQNLIIWNGARIYQNSHFFGLTSAFNENLIDDIEIYDNATPSNYGNNVSGSIVLKHQIDEVKKPSAGLAVNFLSVDAFLKQPINDKMWISGTVRKSLTDFWDSPTYETYSTKAFRDSNVTILENNSINEEDLIRNTDFSFQDAELHFGWNLKKNWDLELHGIAFENRLDYDESLFDDSRQSELKQTNYGLSGKLNYKLNDKHNFNFKSAYSNYDSESKNHTFSSLLDNDQLNKVEDFRTSLNWKYDFKINQQLILGAEFNGIIVTNSYDRNESNISFFNDEVENIYAPYFEYDITLKNWDLNLGSRISYYEKLNEVVFEPRVNIDYFFTDRLIFNLRGEIKSQNIYQLIDLENNFLDIEKRRWSLANEIGLPLQKSQQIELGLSYKQPIFSLYLNGYYKIIDGITTMGQEFRNQGEFENSIGESHVKGVLLHSNIKWKNLNTWLSYSLLDETYKFDNLSFSEFNGNNDITNRLLVGSSYKFKNFITSVSLEYYTGKPYTTINVDNPINFDTTGNTINYNEVNKQRLPDYLRIDVSIQYLYKWSSGKLFKAVLGLTNLTDHNNFLRRNFRLNQISNTEVITVEDKGLEFTPNLGIQIIF